MGNSPSPVEFTGNDLHSYVVVNEGRSYVAISEIPGSLGPSLQPLAAVGSMIGWAFALEQPGFKNGFSIIGEGNWLRVWVLSCFSRESQSFGCRKSTPRMASSDLLLSCTFPGCAAEFLALLQLRQKAGSQSSGRPAREP